MNDSIFYSILVDEVTDYSNKEHFIIYFRWNDKDFGTHEDFIGIYNVADIKAEAPVTVITDVFIWLKISLSMLVVSATMVQSLCVVLKMVFLVKFYQKIQKHFSLIVLGML